MDPGPIHRRRRPAIACTECRRRKVSCDLASPCGPCRKSRSSLRCIYNNNNNNSNTASSKAKVRKASTDSLSNTNNTVNSRRTHHRGRRSTSDFSSRQGSEDTPETSASGSSSATYTSLADPGHPSLSSAPMIADLDQDMLDWDFPALHMNNLSGFDFLHMDQMGYHEPPPHPKPSLSLPEGLWETSKSIEFPPMSHCGQLNFDLEHYWDLQPSTSPHLEDRAIIKQPLASEWLSLGVGREVVLHLLRRYTRAVPNTDVAVPSGDEMARPLMEILAKLEQAAIQEHEKRAVPAPYMWSDPSSPDLTVTAARKLLPSRLQCDALVKTYINTFESVLSIFHVPSFLQKYKRLWEAPSTTMIRDDTAADETFICNLLLIITLGSYASLSPHTSTEGLSALQSQAECWMTFVKHWTTRQMVSGYRASIGTTQTMCLMALTKLIRPQHNVGAGVNLLLGDYDLIRIGFQIGLHRNPAVNMSQKDAEMHRGLWATILELSLQQCFDKGLQAPVTPASYDCEPQSGNKEEETEGAYEDDLDGNGERLSPMSSGVGKLTIIEMLAKSQKLRIQVLNVLNAPRSPQAYDNSHQLAAELNAICNSNLATLRRTRPSSTRDFQIHMLEMFIRPFVIALHSPFADQASATNPTYYYSRMMRMELSALLLTHPYSQETTHHDGNQNNNGGSSAASLWASSSYWQSIPDLMMKQHQRTSQTVTAANTNPNPYDLMMHSNIDAIHSIRDSPENKHHRTKTNSDGSEVMMKTPDQERETTSPSSEALPPDVYASLLLHGHGFYAHARRQATAALFLDLMRELEEQAFPTLQGATRQRLREVLQNVVSVFEQRVVCSGGTHSTREFVLFSAAAAYVDDLLAREQRGIGSKVGVGVGIGIGGAGVTFDKAAVLDDMEGAVASAATKALTLCAEIVGQRSLSVSSSSSAQSVNLFSAGF